VKVSKKIYLAVAVLILTLGFFGVKHFRDQLPAIPADSIRIHCYGLGNTEKDSVLSDQQLVDSSIPSYSVVKIQTKEVNIGGNKVWICDATLDIKKSVIEKMEQP
jgi:hypothetical protein